MFESPHYRPKKVSEIAKTNGRVAVIGTIIEVKDGSFILDDGSGKIEIFSGGKVDKGRVVRAFCSNVDGNLSADIIQDLSKLDLNLFNKVQELYKKAGV